jgi:hypothetical protein
MDRHEVNKVAHFTPSGGGHHLVHGKVNRVQDVTASLIAHGREKPKITVNDPFKARAGVLPGDFGGID